MYCLYDTDGMLRFVNSDKNACLDYAELFELSSTNYSLMNSLETSDKHKEEDFNFDLNQEENNN